MPEYEPKALFDKALYEVVNVTDVSRFGTKQAPRGQELLAIDQRTSIEYRQEDGSLFHRYGLPRQYSTVQLKHYFHYLRIKDIYKLPVESLKADFIANIAQIIRKLAVHKKVVSIFEIGSSVGENYIMVKDLIEKDGLACTLKYVGMELEGTMVEFSREFHRGDPNVQFVHAEASDLGRFPDRAFDICISHGVSNHLTDPTRGFLELIRVSRVAVLLHTLIHQGENALNLTMNGTGYRTWVPTMATLKGLAAREVPMLYYLSKFKTLDIHQMHDMYGGYFFEDVADKRITWENLVFSRYEILPELGLLDLNEGLGVPA